MKILIAVFRYLKLTEISKIKTCLKENKTHKWGLFHKSKFLTTS